MKILMLTPYLPYPLVSGGQIRTYNLLKNLSRKHQITLFSYIRSNKEQQYKQELLKYCQAVHTIKRRRPWALKNILLSGFSPYPFLVCLYLSRGLRKALEKLLKQEQFDLIHAETFYVMPQLPATEIPILLVEQTIEWMVYERYMQEIKNILLKPFLLFDVWKIKFWEKHFWHQATRLATVSEEDREIISKTISQHNISIVANGVDIEFFAQTKKSSLKTGGTKTDEKTVLFVGNFKWLPNSDAAIFLANKIWPQVKQKIKHAKLYIVGKNPTDKILSLASPNNIVVKGDVDDIRTAFATADIMVAPIRNGRGTKYKVLEAIATQTPVVATPLGVEGLHLKEGVDVLIGRTAQEIADQAVFLLKNKHKGQVMAKSAYQTLKSHYNWQVISSQLDKIYQKMGERR